jgi:hypothetical protein
MGAALHLTLSLFYVNDFELAIKTSKDLELMLARSFGASGRGLHEKINSVAGQLPDGTIRQLRYIATIRNRIIHEQGFDRIPDRGAFLSTASRCRASLSQTSASSSCSVM